MKTTTPASESIRTVRPARNRDRLHRFPVPATGISHAGIRKCLIFMSGRFHRPINLKDLVKVSRLSPRGFSKAFRRHLGTSPAAVLRNLRIEHAKQLLSERRLPVQEVALRSGYRNANSFWVAFRRATSVGPRKFRGQLAPAGNDATD